MSSVPTKQLAGTITGGERRTLQKRLIVISGISGAGKTTLARGLASALGGIILVSHTSRNPRDNEVDGRDYYFTSRQGMDALNSAGLLIESAHYDGELYGLSALELARALKHNGPAIVVMTTDGRAALSAAVGFRPTSLWLDCQFETARARLLRRGNGHLHADRRLGNAERERDDAWLSGCWPIMTDGTKQETLEAAIRTLEAVSLRQAEQQDAIDRSHAIQEKACQ